MKKLFPVLLSLLFLGVVKPSPAPAAELYGWYRVGDGASIALLLCRSGGERAAQTTTDDKGYYRFRGLNPGEYRITAGHDCKSKARGWQIYVTPGYSRFDLM